LILQFSLCAALTEKVPLHSLSIDLEPVGLIAYGKICKIVGDRHFRSLRKEAITTNVIIIIEQGWR
jgi:hypothetical protein